MKHSMQEIKERQGEYDKNGFYRMPDGDFFDPYGHYFNKDGYDLLGGYYDKNSG